MEASYEPGAKVQEVADCFEVAPAQIYVWRRQVADGTIDGPVTRSTPTFARVALAEPDVPVVACAGGPSTIEIRLPNGMAIIVGNDVNENALIRVLAALGR